MLHTKWKVSFNLIDDKLFLWYYQKWCSLLIFIVLHCGSKMCSFQNYTCLIKFFWMQFNVIPRTIVSQKCSQAQISNSPSIKYSSNVFHERSLIGTFAQQVTTCVRNNFKPVAAEPGLCFKKNRCIYSV